jgi:hypothetical protein
MKELQRKRRGASFSDLLQALKSILNYLGPAAGTCCAKYENFYLGYLWDDWPETFPKVEAKYGDGKSAKKSAGERLLPVISSVEYKI